MGRLVSEIRKYRRKISNGLLKLTYVTAPSCRYMVSAWLPYNLSFGIFVLTGKNPSLKQDFLTCRWEFLLCIRSKERVERLGKVKEKGRGVCESGVFEGEGAEKELAEIKHKSMT